MNDRDILTEQELNAVSGGDKATLEQQQKDLEAKKQTDALALFQQALKELP